MRFLFIVHVIEKAQMKAQLFLRARENFSGRKIVLRGLIQPHFLHGGERLACFEMQPRQQRFGEF